MMPIHVSNEIDELRAVLVHRPDSGIGRITPRRAEELLFDDIVHLPLMQKEHDTFVQVMKRILPNLQIFEVEQLLVEGLSAHPAFKEELIEKTVAFEELPRAIGKALGQLSPVDLAQTLITGHLNDQNRFLFDPIPKFYFHQRHRSHDQ